MKKIFLIIIMLVSVLLLKNNVYAYREYKIGDIVIYNKEAYYVIEDSESDLYYVTLLKAEPLTADEVNENSENEYVSVNGEMPFADTCEKWEDVADWHLYCTSYNYEDSNIKVVLNNWINKFEDDLVSVDDYKVRLLTVDDMLTNLNYKSDSFFADREAWIEINQYKWLNYTSETPNWVDRYSYSYWGMDGYVVHWKEMHLLDKIGNNIMQDIRIRPVINLKKV